MLCLGVVVAGIILLVVFLTRKNLRGRDEELPRPKLCAQCGKYCAENYAFCPNCGKPISKPGISPR